MRIESAARCSCSFRKEDPGRAALYQRGLPRSGKNDDASRHPPRHEAARIKTHGFATERVRQ